MKKIILFVFILVLLGLSVNVFAIQNEKNNIGALAGAYIGINAGIGDMKLKDLSAETKKSVSYYKVSKGRYAVHPYVGYLWNIYRVPGLKLGMKLGYFYVQNNKVQLNEQKWKYTEHSADLLGEARYNVMQSKFFLLGEFGLLFSYQILEMSGYGEPASSKKNAIFNELGAGFGYDFTHNFEANLIIKYTDIANCNNSLFYGKTSLYDIDQVMSTKAITIGIAYHFG